MKNSSDKSVRIRVYAMTAAVMLVISVIVSVVAWNVARSYDAKRKSEDAAASEQRMAEIETAKLSEFTYQAWQAAYGFYYLMHRNDEMYENYDVTPSEVFGMKRQANAYFGSGGNDSFGDGEDSDYTDSQELYGVSRDFNVAVETCYSAFWNTLKEENLEYYVEDTKTGDALSSIDGMTLSDVKRRTENASFYMQLKIDADGQMHIMNTDANYSGNLSDIYVDNVYNMSGIMYDQDSDYRITQYPANMLMYFYSDASTFYDNASDMYENDYYVYSSNVMYEGFLYSAIVFGILTVAAAWVLLSIKKLKLREGFLTKIPLGVAVLLGILAVCYYLLMMEGCLELRIYHDTNVSDTKYQLLFMAMVIAAAFGAQIMLFMAAGGVYSIATLGPKTYFKEKTLVWRFVRWCRKKVVKLYDESTRLVFEAGNHKTLLKVVGINFLVVALLCCLWFPGIFGSIIYSIIVFVIALKYLERIKAQYEVVHQAAKDMADGHLDTDMNGDAGSFEPLREDLAKVREGVKIAVAEELKSQKMKSELITNVSHDLKTPLTAIITYTDLLKNENLSEEDRKKYVDILDQKADRLKRLIEDLFEVSKANSGNIKVTKTRIDLSDLVRQAVVENEDKLKTASVDLRLSLPEGKVMLDLDGQKVYRIMDNLLGNVAKYSLAGTRAYVSLTEQGQAVMMTVKNISAGELPEDVSSLTERFVRGDQSRNTEGSGLGLAIVKSFAELMGGTLDISVDGDLFKAVVTFYKEENESDMKQS